MAAHVADCSPGVRKVLKSLWEVEAMSPGVADHITLGITAGAGLAVVRVAVAGGGVLRSPQHKGSSRGPKHKEFLMFPEVWASATTCYYQLLATRADAHGGLSLGWRQQDGWPSKENASLHAAGTFRGNILQKHPEIRLPIQ